MRGIVRMLQAHSVILLLSLVAISTMAAAHWQYTAVVVDLFYPRRPRSFGVAEAAGVVMSVLLPALALGPFAVRERRARGTHRLLLTTSGLLLVTLPVLPFAIWVNLPRPGNQSASSNLPFVASMMMYAIVGSLSVRLAGVLAGTAVFLSLYAGLVVGQNYFGPTFLWGSFSTGNLPQTNWWLLAALLIALALVNWRTRSTQRLRILES